MPAPTPAKPPREFDRAEAARVCEDLSHQLADSDAAAHDVLVDHAPLLQAALGARYDTIWTAIENYDYDGALGEIAAARAEGGF